MTNSPIKQILTPQDKKSVYEVDLHKKIYQMMGLESVDLSNIRPEKIDLKKNFWNLYIMIIKINNVKHRFLVDTASQISLIKMKKNVILQELQLDKRLKLNGFGKVTNLLKAVVVDDFKFGTNQAKNVLLFIKEENNMLFNMLRIDGILGWDLLSKIDFSIQEAENSFTIFDEEMAKKFQKIPSSHLFSSMIPIIFNSNKTRIVGIDLGANKTWISEKSSILVGNPLLTERKTYSIGVNGINVDKKGILTEYELKLPNITQNFKKLSISSTEFVPNTKIDLMVGTEICKGKEVVFYNSKNKFFVNSK
ncbi:retropepsin-like aspartic protease [Oceanobacillus kapialis]|uniref:retropepsin-like aspartic protease n=1 Tax=Oceanobacillus kapialis TaxID=481353 RepID=UPI00384E43F2